jgi:hypothetical protein
LLIVTKKHLMLGRPTVLAQVGTDAACISSAARGVHGSERRSRDLAMTLESFRALAVWEFCFELTGQECPYMWDELFGPA